MNLLEINALKIMFSTPGGLIRAVEGIDLYVEAGESVALVGESGCGKSVTGFSIMRLLKTPPAIVSADKLQFEEIDIKTESEARLQELRGDEISMIFQEPSAALNPVMSVGAQVDEVFIKHRNMKRKEAKAASIALLRDIGIAAPERRYSQYPHELSGGMKQRILIAIAMACEPKLLIADEPTTALDVTIQAQILTLIAELQAKLGTAMLLITHDLGVVAHSASRVYVMYCGKIVEHGAVEDILRAPLHPYTKGLIRAVPRLSEREERFVQIKGSVPHPSDKPSGCYFHSRCEDCREICKAHMPPLTTLPNGRQVRCWYADKAEKADKEASK